MLLTALLFALAQAVTEFLPVSSSGHLALLSQLIDAPADRVFVATVLHIATAVAAIVYYRRRYWEAIKDLGTPRRRPGQVLRYGLTQIITGVIASLFALALNQPALYEWWVSAWFVGAMMLVNAAVLAVAPAGRRAPDDGRMPYPSWRAALMVGAAQGIALAPGLSRSGFAIVAGLAAGLDRGAAVHFAMLLAPVVILASAIGRATQVWPEPLLVFGSWQSALIMAAMLAATFVIALAALRWTVAWTLGGRLRWFAPWSAALGIAALVFAAIG